MSEANGPEATSALMQRVLARGDDEAANALLQAFFRGLPVERLLVLLRSDSADAARAGAWIASELGEQAAPLVDEFASLIDHPARYVRFFLVDAILASATSRDGDAIARALSKLRDSDEAVRWKALHFVAKATVEQLAAGSRCIADLELRSQLEWLLADTLDPTEVVARLDADDELGQMVAAAAAARFATQDPTPLQHAAASEHPEVSSFANEELEGLRR